MKKLFGILLSLVIVINLIPFPAFAAENSSCEYDEIIEAACEVFPEYAVKILCNTPDGLGYSRTRNSATLVICETRSVSENQEITYAEFSNGAVVLASNVFSKVVTPTSSNELGGVVTTTCEIKVVCNYASKIAFKLSRFIYKMLANDYDYIVSKGTASADSYSGAHCVFSEDDYVQYETATQNAHLYYTLDFYDNSSNCFDCDLSITIGNNGFSCNVNSHVG